MEENQKGLTSKLAAPEFVVRKYFYLSYNVAIMVN